MLTTKTKQTERFHVDIANPAKLQNKLNEMYLSELNETLDKILLKKEEEFMKTLSNRVQILLSQEYSEEIFNDSNLTSLIQSIEKETFTTLYQPLRLALNKLLEKEQLISIENLSFRKHCNYQGNQIIHQCPNGKASSSFLCNDSYAICSSCSLVYRISCVKLYCDFCSVEYFTALTDNTNKKTKLDIQPATWDKYHCKIVFDDQMKCIQCKEKLYINLTENMLLCLSCNFTSDPYAILWRCIICSAEFRSNAKIYNPLEYKMFKTTIKEAIVRKEYAKPDIFPCNHENSSSIMTHKVDCEGKLLVGYYHDSKMVICDKCNIVTLYDKFIWTCSVCNKRFRERNNNDKTIGSMNDDDCLSYNSSTSDSLSFMEKVQSFNIKRTFSDESPSVIENKRKDSLKPVFKNNIQEIISLPPMNQTTPTPHINLEDYTVISEISAGSTGKVYAVKDDNDNKFYALKKQAYKEGFNKIYDIYYTIQSTDIVQLKGIAIDEEQNELNILVELGLCDLEKEIISRKRIKKYYSENELMSMLFQITSALCSLQLNGYVHWNISPYNIIAFKEGRYKLCDFTSLRKISENIWAKGNNYFTPPRNQTSDMVKADTYCLGLTLLYTSTLEYQSVEDIIALDYTEKDYKGINRSIKKILMACLPKERFSEQYIELMGSMLNANVNERIDFMNVYNYITTIYSHEVNESHNIYPKHK